MTNILNVVHYRRNIVDGILMVNITCFDFHMVVGTQSRKTEYESALVSHEVFCHAMISKCMTFWFLSKHLHIFRYQAKSEYLK